VLQHDFFLNAKACKPAAPAAKTANIAAEVTASSAPSPQQTSASGAFERSKRAVGSRSKRDCVVCYVQAIEHLTK
jgi:hypothetical protein